MYGLEFKVANITSAVLCRFGACTLSTGFTAIIHVPKIKDENVFD